MTFLEALGAWRGSGDTTADAERSTELHRCAAAASEDEEAQLAVEDMWEQVAAFGHVALCGGGDEGGGLVATRDLPNQVRGTRWPLAGVVTVTDWLKGDQESRMELPKNVNESGTGGSLVGPLAMVNAACGDCANLRFSQIYWLRGVLRVKAVQTRRIRRGEQFCARYGLNTSCAQCVRCGKRLQRDPHGQGGHTWETPPAGWGAVHVKYGRTYWVHIASGRARWPEDVRVEG